MEGRTYGMETSIISYPKDIQGNSFCSKVLFTISWHAQEVLLLEILKVVVHEYCAVVSKWKKEIWSKRTGLFIYNFMLLDKNTRPYSARATIKPIETISWERPDHPPYIPDLEQRGFHLLLAL